MKNVLIIGGSYFAGRVFVEELLKRGAYSIYVLNRGNIPLKKNGVQEIKCDRHDPERLKQSIPRLDWEAVVDFCAYTPEDIAGMMLALAECRVSQYIYISTASVYAKTNDFPVKEVALKLEGPQPELGPFADYAYNKWRAEIELEKRCKDRAIHFTSIRPAFIYGKYNYAPRESFFFDLISRGEPIVIPENSLALFSFVSVWDVAKITTGCIGNERVFNGAFNAAAEELISYSGLFEVFQTITEKKLDLKLMSINEINEKNIPLPFPLDEHLIYSGRLIEEILAFKYMHFIEGMRGTYKYYLIGKGLQRP